MCGIVGYIGDNKALPFLINGLKKLEYRGYDSAGLCIKKGKSLIFLKEKGKVEKLEKLAKNFSIFGNIGIAHTRWATHGIPNKINAHPHHDCKKNIAIVHNGIIENYNSLKKLLKKENHKIISETDSELIAHLVEKFYENDLEKAVLKTLKIIEGTFGLLVIDKHGNKIIAAKRSSPLVLGIGQGEMFVASDAAALLEKTKKAVYLSDEEVAIISKDGYRVKNLKGKVVDKKIHKIVFTLNQIEKRGFKHFMLKEIFEQPEAIENTLRGKISGNLVRINLGFDFKKINQIIIVACGTSWHSALLGKYIIEKLTNIPVQVDYASEFRYRNPIIKKGDLFIAISQSGETADTLAALREAKNKGAKTLGIINVVGSSIAREVDSGIYLHAGPEIGVASTKAFTCQVTALLLLALRANQNGQKLAVNSKILKELINIPRKIKIILQQSVQIRNLAKKLKNSKNFLYLGRNLNFPVALEGALKLKEISYIHAEGYPAAEMKHGPIALIDKNMPVVFISPNDDTYNKILNNMEEVKARGGNIIAVINKNDAKIARLVKHIIKTPQTMDIFSPLLNVVPLQLLAYHIADLKKLNVDRPRNLAKSVTVE